MEKARKPDRARPKAAGPSPSKGGPAAPPSRREVRVDRRALAVVVLAGVLAVPALLGLKAFQDRSGRSALLLEARRQRDEARRPELALGYFNRYLELVPGDLDAADQRASLLAETAREPAAIESAIRAHVLLLGRAGDGRGRGAARKRLAGLYLRLHQFRAAEQASRDHLRLEPGDVEGRRLLARALEGSGRMGDAGALGASVAEYEAAEALEPGDVASGERLAALYLDKFGDKARATRVVDALLERHPRSVAARLARARFFAAAGEPRAASGEVDEAIRLDPDGVDARLAAAEAAARGGDPAAARAHLEAIKPPGPDDLRFKIIRGQVELAERRVDLAIRDWRDGLALSDGSDAELTWRLALVLIQLGRPREAAPLIAQYRRLSGGDDPSPACRFLVGLASLEAGRVAEAVAELEAIRYKIAGGLEGQLQMALGRAYEASREPAKAADAYASATTSTGADAAPWLALAGLQGDDRPADQAATLERGVAAVGPDERLLAGLARALWRVQAGLPAAHRDWSGLDQVLEQGEATAPGSVGLVLVRADRAAASGRPEDGLAVLGAAIGRDPGSAPLRLALAEAMARLGRVDEAAARLDEAVARVGDRADFRIARARLALSKGEARAAGAALAEGLGRVPEEQRPLLARALGEFHVGQGDRAAARRAFLGWASLRPDSIEPHLALLNLAIEGGDDRSVDLEVEALKAIGGPSSVTWKVARAESLLRDRPGPPPSPSTLDEAAGLVAEVEAAAPRQPAGPLLEARLMERRGKPDLAIRAYEKAVELKAGPTAVGPLAGLLARLGRVDELESLRSKVGGFPPEVERMAGAEALRRGPAGEAEELARRMVEGDPAGLDARAWQAKVLEGLGRPAEAEATLRKLVDLRPESPAPWVQLLTFQVARRDRAGASETIARMKGRVKVDRPDLLRATCCRAAGLRDQADRAFLDALEAAPGELPTLRSAVDYYEETGRPGLAEPLLRRLRKASPGLDWARRRLALNLATRPGDPASWREALDLAGEGSDASDSPDDRLARGVVLSLGPAPRRVEGVAILEKLAAEMPDNPGVQEALARALLGSGERPRAREHADRAARAAGAPPGSIRLAGSLDLAAGDLDAASRRVDRLEAVAPDDPATIELKARLLKARGKSGEAVALIERAFDEAGTPPAPASAEAGRALVRLLAGLDEPEAAERLARKVASLGHPGLVVLAEWLASRGRFDEASAAYDSAAVDRPGARESARSALALASRKREPRWSDLADRLLDRAIGAGPVDDEMAYARASLRHLQGRLEEAVKLYDELAGRPSADASSSNNAAWVLSEELGRPLEGLARVEALAARGDVVPHTLDTRGVILLRLGRLDRAIVDLEAAAGAIPSGPICYHLARAYLAAGRRGDAAKALASASAAGLKPESLQPSERAEFARVSAALK